MDWTWKRWLFLISGLIFMSTGIHGVDLNVDTLRFVHVVWRHGDRSPSDPTFPTDTGKPEWSWPQGWGQLTTIGMRQHMALGAYLRKRYVDSGFLMKNYNASQIYVRSSDYNRTIMSALSNLAGMYPSESGEALPGLNWQPIPVHVVQKDEDPLIWMDRPCPKAHDIYFNEILVSDEAKQAEADNLDLLTYLREKTGHPISTWDDMRFIFDPLNCERIHNETHKWPGWVNPSLFARIEELYRISKTFSFRDPRMQRFRGSLLFWDIAERSQWKATNDSSLLPSTLKYYAYSAHDTTIIALFENLGVYESIGAQPPPYAAAVMFELHERDGKYFIQVVYVNETGSESPVTLTVKGCQADGCTLAQFVDMARRQTPTDWKGECGFEEKVARHKYTRAKVAAEVLGATTALLLILLMIAVAQIIRRSGRGSYTA